MEPLISFKEGEVFTTMAPSNWMEVTSPWSTETMPEEFHKSHTHSWAQPRGSLSAAHTEGWPATTAMWATTKAEALTTPPWEFMPHLI